MIADFKVCLDACVLANQGVCDLLIRLAEHPRLYTPVFSKDILAEVRHVHLEKLKKPWPEELADYWQSEMRNAFPEALVENYHQLIPALTNHEDDRHVLAAAIRGDAQLIVTFNLKDFPKESLKPWDICAVHPQEYLITLYEMSPDIVLSKIYAIAQEYNREPIECLKRLSKSVPRFSETVAKAIGWNLTH